jgi:hypothetical protein
MAGIGQSHHDQGLARGRAGGGVAEILLAIWQAGHVVAIGWNRRRGEIQGFGPEITGICQEFTTYACMIKQ